MLDFTICSINAKYTHASLAPWCILSGIREYSLEDINARVVESTINESEDKLFERIAAEHADVIGFCTYIWNVTLVKRLAKRMKSAFPDIIVLLGGPEVSYNAEDVLMENPYVDYVISGEGEKSTALLLDAIAGGYEVPTGYGICSRGREEEPYVSCEETPSPYCDEFFAALGNRIPYIETSRGCPYSCAFCLSGRCGGVRYFDMERVKREIILLAEKSVSTVKFIDRTFNANKKRSKEILCFVSENIKRDVCFHFEIAGDILDNETIEIINSAPKGRFQLEIGMQSFNERTLEYINRKTDCEKLKQNILRLTEKKNVHVHIDLIAGLPYEDMESFKKSFNTAFSLGADMLQMGFLKLLHGADMREDKEKYPCEFSAEPPYEVLSTPWLTREEMQTLHLTEDALDRLCNSGRFRRTILYILGSSGRSPFDIFSGFGTSAGRTDGMSLDDYTALVYNYFSDMSGVDKNVLRDKMVCDRFATNSFGALPAALKIKEPLLIKKAKAYLYADEKTRPKKNTKRSIAILYSECTDEKYCGVYADYSDEDKNRHGISAPEYELHKFYFT